MSLGASPPLETGSERAGSKRLRVLLAAGRVVATVAIVIYIYRRQDWANLGETMRRIHVMELGGAALLQGCTIALMAMRWQRLLWSQDIRLTFARSTQLVLTGLFFNLFYLGSVGGDMARFAGAVEEARQHKTRLLLSLLQDRLIGLGALLILLTGFTVFHYRIMESDPRAHLLLVGIPTATAAYLCGLLFFRWRARRPATLPGASVAKPRFTAAFRDLVPQSALPLLLALSLLIHICGFLAGWVAAHAVGVTIAFSEAGLVLGITALALSLPITIAGLGVREVMLGWLLALFGVKSTGMALGLSGALLGISLLWASVGAVAFFWPTAAGAAPNRAPK